MAVAIAMTMAIAMGMAMALAIATAMTIFNYVFSFFARIELFGVVAWLRCWSDYAILFERLNV